jgi:hypothetical protein
MTLSTGIIVIDYDLLKLKDYEIRHKALRELDRYVGGMP